MQELAERALLGRRRDESIFLRLRRERETEGGRGRGGCQLEAGERTVRGEGSGNRREVERGGRAGRRRSEEEKPKTLARDPIDGREGTPRPDAGGDPRDAVPRADAGAHERAKRIRRGGAGRVDAWGSAAAVPASVRAFGRPGGLFPRAPNLPGCAEGTEPRAPRCGRERATERAGRDAHHDGALLLVLGDSRAGNRGRGRRARGAFRLPHRAFAIADASKLGPIPG